MLFKIQPFSGIVFCLRQSFDLGGPPSPRLWRARPYSPRLRFGRPGNAKATLRAARLRQGYGGRGKITYFAASQQKQFT